MEIASDYLLQLGHIHKEMPDNLQQYMFRIV